MKKIYYLLLSISFLCSAKAQQWEWAKKTNDVGYFHRGIFQSLNNGFFMAGQFRYNLTLDNFNIQAPGDSGFLAMYDLNGNCQWLKKNFIPFNEENSGASNSGLTDTYGNIYL